MSLPSDAHLDKAQAPLLGDPARSSHASDDEDDEPPRAPLLGPSPKPHRSTQFLTDDSGHGGNGLGVWSVMAIAFFTVSGGPWGSEGIVSTAGPALGLSSLIVFPLVFCIPQALITAELSTAFPSNGGYSLWVTAAFGKFWGVQESYWSWFSGVVDCAMYPLLFYSAATAFAGAVADTVLQTGHTNRMQTTKPAA